MSRPSELGVAVTQDGGSGASGGGTIAPLKVPALWTFVGLAAGLALGLLMGGSAALAPLLSVAAPLGTLWLRALQMTILPLVAALLVIGINTMVDTARAGPMAARTLASFIGILAAGTVFAALVMPALLGAFPPPAAAGAAIAANVTAPAEVPGIADFFAKLVPDNVFTAAADNAILSVILFFVVTAFAIARLPADQRALLLRFFTALGNAMLVIIGWVLWLAPIGVFALALGVAANTGAAAIGVFAHYIACVSAMGAAVLLTAYAVGAVFGRRSLPVFVRAAFPAQAVALSTQSSLASLPAMLASCRALQVRETTADFVLPLAVAIFRATSPGMNLAVAIYVAWLSGVALTPGVLLMGMAVALATTMGSVSLPGSISFITSIGPIALAMGVPVGPLALLVAVEMLPDIMRTVGNVTMDIAVTAAIDRASGAMPDERD